MLKHEDIQNGKLVRNEDNGTFHVISEVGNAVQKGDRLDSAEGDTELSYTITDILTNKADAGICEHSHMTSIALSPASREDALLYLTSIEADVNLKLAKTGKKLVRVKTAINYVNKLI